MSESVEGDIVLLEMARALHAGVRDEPFARMDFSDAQWARLEAAAAVVRAPLLAALQGTAALLREGADTAVWDAVIRCSYPNQEKARKVRNLFYDWRKRVAAHFGETWP